MQRLLPVLVLAVACGEFDGMDKFWDKEGVMIQDRRWRAGELAEN